ncbi:hypothetical protein C9927_03205 [Pseudidiomarina aestuarii]|uniref:PepSY domain-containing protein n=1 Tax=Pseudidiomarina aestuarii TaxID=624146 RepID=A0A2T4D4P7_9GAMM|nr:hypothetical protein C9927_03205 [Pseudidiomarina aestuarii]PTB90251.1 hypothetical protein C9928_00580 [Pseudidiomarina aestuarii]
MAVSIPSSRWRVWHRWLAILVGLQMVVWSISGGYMVFFELSFIHGDHLVRDTSAPMHHTNEFKSFADVQDLYPDASSIQLTSIWLNQRSEPVYKVNLHHNSLLLDAQTLEPVKLDSEDIRGIAENIYNLGDQPAERVQWLTENPPTELNPDLLPVWRVDFDDFGSTSLYFSPDTGDLVTKRHTFWRGFDIMWMMHIMDYEERVDIESWLLRSFIILNFVFMITGAVLVFFTIRKPKTAEVGQ